MDEPLNGIKNWKITKDSHRNTKIKIHILVPHYKIWRKSE